MTNVSFATSLGSVKIGNAGEIAVDVAKFNETVLAHVFGYGLKQILNDTRSAEKDSDKAMALVEKKLAALYAGTLRAAGERETDPVKAEAKKIATSQIMAALKAKGLKKEQLAEGKFVELVKARAAKPEVMEVARANVEAAKGLEIEDDLLDGIELEADVSGEDDEDAGEE